MNNPKLPINENCTNCVSLQYEFDKLNDEYIELKKSNNNLIRDYSENIIIQSMEDMKTQYNTLSKTLDIYKNNSVPTIRYQKILDKYNNLIEIINGSSVIIKQSQSTLEKIKLDKKYLPKLEIYLLVLHDIINSHQENV